MGVINRDRRETRHNDRRETRRINRGRETRRITRPRIDPFKQLLRSSRNARGVFSLRLNSTNAGVRSENNFLGIDFFLGMVRSFGVLRQTHTSFILDAMDRDRYKHLRRLLRNALNDNRLEVSFSQGRPNQLRVQLFLIDETQLVDDQLLSELLSGKFLRGQMETHMSTHGFVLFESERYVNIRHEGRYCEYQ